MSESTGRASGTRRIQWTGDLIELFFPRGLDGVIPVFGSFELRNLSII
jgi:hypothetical protein